MENIVDIEHMLHKHFSILDSKIVTMAKPKATKLDSNCSEKIVVV